MKVLVVGDTILDIYSHGTVERISPEAPVPVFDHSHDEKVLGGACNVAANVRSLSRDDNLEIDFFGFYSPDIKHMLGEYCIECIGIPCGPEDVLQKKRIVADKHQLVRIDNHKKYKDTGLAAVLHHKWNQINFEDYDLLVLSDYDKGTLTEKEFKTLVDLQHIPKVIDLKRVRATMEDFDKHRHLKTIVKCNMKEYLENSRITYLSELVVITKGADGYMLPNTQENFPSVRTNGEVVDVVGAGDVYLAGMAVNFLESKSFDIYAMSAFGNLCAGEKVKHFGTFAVKRDLL